MDPSYQEIIRRRLELPLHEGPDKRATLADALRRHVQAGDTLYLGAAHGRPLRDVLARRAGHVFARAQAARLDIPLGRLLADLLQHY